MLLLLLLDIAAGGSVKLESHSAEFSCGLPVMSVEGAGVGGNWERARGMICLVERNEGLGWRN